MGIPSLTEEPRGKLRSSTTRLWVPSLGTVSRGDVRRGAGKGLHVNGPAVAECSISVDKKASITSGKLVAEAWFGG